MTLINVAIDQPGGYVDVSALGSTRGGQSLAAVSQFPARDAEGREDSPLLESPAMSADTGRSAMIGKLISLTLASGFSVAGFAARFDVGAVLTGLTAVVGTTLFLLDRWHKDKSRREDDDARRKREKDEEDAATARKIEAAAVAARVSIQESESAAKLKIARAEARERIKIARELEEANSTSLMAKLAAATETIAAANETIAQKQAQIDRTAEEVARLDGEAKLGRERYHEMSAHLQAITSKLDLAGMENVRLIEEVARLTQEGEKVKLENVRLLARTASLSVGVESVKADATAAAQHADQNAARLDKLEQSTDAG